MKGSKNHTISTVETQRNAEKGGELLHTHSSFPFAAPTAWEPRKGSVLATKAVKTQGKGENTRQRQFLSRKGSEAHKANAVS